jgi:phage-related protein
MERDAREQHLGLQTWTIEYYETEGGNCPVLEWIQEMTPQRQAAALRYIDQLALLGTEAKAPLIKSLGDKLYELRWKAEDKQHRIAYFAALGHTFVLLHGIVKKQMAWSKKDLDLAKKRRSDYERRMSR